ncbi:hypothetical protein GBA52_012636 [Prunus armeniaca]|nr:hypothetical protein GBA52_012636 [Prunus armeniaca]
MEAHSSLTLPSLKTHKNATFFFFLFFIETTFPLSLFYQRLGFKHVFCFSLPNPPWPWPSPLYSTALV